MCLLDIQGEQYELTNREKKLHYIGVIAFFLLIMMTIFFGNSLSPLKLLQLRLTFVTIAIIYHLLVYYFQLWSFKKTAEQQTKSVVICFNGKELGKK